jgi:glycosyltransferase involved in cell wall biosynthesis
MIIKNEEAFLEPFIRCHRNFFDDWVIVDTGSTDRSLDIIKEAGLPVYQFKWINDFSAARNYALSLCKGDWVAAFDADEFLDFEGQQQIRYFIEKSNIDAYEIDIYNYISEENLLKYCSEHLVEYVPPNDSYKKAILSYPHKEKNLKSIDYGYRKTQLIRFFRNRVGFHWESPIHEVLSRENSSSQGKTAQLDGVPIHHLGMLNIDNKAHQKKDMYTSISKSMHEELKNSKHPKLLFEAARHMRDPKEKLECLKKVIALAPRDITVLKETANTFLAMNDPMSARKVCKELVEAHPQSLEGLLALAHSYSIQGETALAIASLKTKIKVFRREAMYNYTLATLHLHNQDLLEALSYITRAYKQAPRSKIISELYKKLHDLKLKESSLNH